MTHGALGRREGVREEGRDIGVRKRSEGGRKILTPGVDFLLLCVWDSDRGGLCVLPVCEE